MIAERRCFRDVLVVVNSPSTVSFNIMVLMTSGSEIPRLPGDLLRDKRRAHEAGTDHVCADPMCRSLPGHMGRLSKARCCTHEELGEFGKRFIRSNRSLLPPRPV
jgi:hypothetical protein